MSSLPEHVLRLTTITGILPAGSRVLVAVSGGRDSMVLLHVLHELAPSRQWKLVAAHLNHQLRGRSSDADARFVERQCERLKVPCVLASRDVKALANQRGVSLEMAAREARQRFLAQTARRRKCPVIAVAHHANDQAELVLLRLLRGSGSEGLGGMSVRGPSPVNSALELVRPFLEVSSERIAAHAQEGGIRFREDRSNADRRFLRNRVRHELLPMLRREYQPAMDRILVRTASILSAEASFLNERAVEWLREPAASFGQLPLALRRRVIQLQALGLGVVLDFEACEQLVVTAGRPVNAPEGERLQRDARGRVVKAGARVAAHVENRRTVLLGNTGRARFAGRQLSWRVVNGRPAEKGEGSAGAERFDADRVGKRIVLRHWQAGDRFQPIGMKTPVKLQDLFTNQKVPRVERHARLVVESEGGEIFWVEGLRIGERFKLVPNTRKSLVWRWNCLTIPAVAAVPRP